VARRQPCGKARLPLDQAWRTPPQQYKGKELFYNYLYLIVNIMLMII
jgi:hypothetical protein